MAKNVTDRPLHDILEGIFIDQKNDIELITRGHLNHNRLWKPPDKATHRPWPSSAREIPLIHQPSKLLPPQSQLPVRQDQMKNAMYNFGVGTSGSIPLTGKAKRKLGENRGSTSPDPRICDEQRPNTAVSYISDSVYVEEMRLPELMLPCLPGHGGAKLSGILPPLDYGQTAMETPNRHQFIESHLGGISKKEQFHRFMDFENDIMRKPDMYEQNVLSGRKVVECLERRLQKKLSDLDDEHRLKGPNFHRLQIYSDTWDEFIQVSPMFGEILSTIKNEYEKYMGSLLDTQPQRHSEVLVQQVESLADGTSVAPGEVDKSRDNVARLERTAQELLKENDRLRSTVHEHRETLANRPVPEPESETQKALRASREHRRREDRPKGIEEQILELHVGILSQMDEVENLRQELKENYVPASVCQHLDQCVRDTEADVLKVLSTNEYLEKTIQQLEADLEKLMSKSNTDPYETRKIWKSINLLSAETPTTEGED